MANLEEIIAAAAKVFQTKGYHAATVQDIADAVGIQKGSLYHHVKSKEPPGRRVSAPADGAR